MKPKIIKEKRKTKCRFCNGNKSNCKVCNGTGIKEEYSYYIIHNGQAFLADTLK